MNIGKFFSRLNPQVVADEIAVEISANWLGPIRDAGIVTPELQENLEHLLTCMAETSRFQYLVSQIVENRVRDNPSTEPWEVLYVISECLENELIPLLHANVISLSDVTPESAVAMSELLLGKFFSLQNWLVRDYNHIQTMFSLLERLVSSSGADEIRATSFLRPKA